MSHGDFVAKADAICTAYAKGTASITRPRTYAEIVAYVEKALPLYQAALQRLDALEPPSADEPAVRAWLAADHRVAKAVRELGLAARRRDFPGVTAAASRAQLEGSASRRAAAELGLHVCARLSDR